jgi:hypothetical protein
VLIFTNIIVDKHAKGDELGMRLRSPDLDQACHVSVVNKRRALASTKASSKLGQQRGILACGV